MKNSKRKTAARGGLLHTIGPGLLVAATGVGAGDLAGGAFAGSKLGVAILWAVLLGAFFKFVLNEGLTRWQLATGTTLLEGAVLRLGGAVRWFFLVYLLLWSFVVGAALISACGVAAHALLPVFDNASTAKLVFGAAHSAAAVALIRFGRYKTFETLMSIAIGVMFLTVLFTAFLTTPDWGSVLSGMVIPSIPAYLDSAGSEQGVYWTLALMGGVGGTLTILSYGYWIREKGREGPGALRMCRVDLIVSYTAIALFGMATVIIASGSNLEKVSSALLVVELSRQLSGALGDAGAALFLAGAWAAIFSSLLGVWQSVPYLFADFWYLLKHYGTLKTGGSAPRHVDVNGKPYLYFLYALAVLPAAGLFYKFVLIQKVYAVFGSLVIPLLAIALLLLNGRKEWVGVENRNGAFSIAGLLAALLVYGWISVPKFIGSIGTLLP